MKCKKLIFLMLAVILGLAPFQVAFAAGSQTGTRVSSMAASGEAATTPTVKTYTVTFVSDTTWSVTVEEGQCVKKPADPIFPPGTTFVGWYSKPGRVFFDFNTPITQDIVLYPYGKIDTPLVPPKPPMPVLVSFDSQGGTAVAAQGVGPGTLLSKPDDPTKPGYKFLGWYTKDGKKWNFTKDIFYPKYGLTFYAHWTLASVSVQFNSRGGSAIKRQKFLAKNKIVKPIDPIKSGYAFIGWYTKDGKKWNFSQTIVEDTTLYARWISLREGVLPPTADVGVSFIPVVLLGIGATGVLALRQRRLSQM